MSLLWRPQASESTWRIKAEGLFAELGTEQAAHKELVQRAQADAAAASASMQRLEQSVSAAEQEARDKAAEIRR